MILAKQRIKKTWRLSGFALSVLDEFAAEI